MVGISSPGDNNFKFFGAGIWPRPGGAAGGGGGAPSCAYEPTVSKEAIANPKSKERICI